MNMWRITALGTVLITASLVTSPAPVTAASPASARLQSLVGSWSCTQKGSMGTQTTTSTASMVGDTFVKFAGNVPAAGKRAAHTSDGYLGYDATKHQWVYLEVNTLGEYFVSKSDAAPTAMTQTWVDAYPVDPNDGPSTLHFTSPTSYTLDSAWKEKGKAMSAHTVCTKQ